VPVVKNVTSVITKHYSPVPALCENLNIS